MSQVIVCHESMSLLSVASVANVVSEGVYLALQKSLKHLHVLFHDSLNSQPIPIKFCLNFWQHTLWVIQRFEILKFRVIFFCIR